MRKVYQLVFGMVTLTTIFFASACSNKEQEIVNGVMDAKMPIEITVSNSVVTRHGGLINDVILPDQSAVGISLTKSDDSPYDTDYTNVQYKATNSGSDQTWNASTPILLSDTKAKVYAYYPYNSEVTDITSIPIDVSENKDVMYATPVSDVNNASPTAPLVMNHALSVIRLSFAKGTYSGTGNITSIKIHGENIAPIGTLNAKTGSLGGYVASTPVDFGVTTQLTQSAQIFEQLVISTGSTSKMIITVIIDGRTFVATTSSMQIDQGKSYQFAITFRDQQMLSSSVSVEGFEFGKSEGVTVDNLSEAWNRVKSTDGIYGIGIDGTPVPYAEVMANEGDNSIIGVAMVMYGRALQISNNIDYSYWGSESIEIAGIDNQSTAGGGVNTTIGYLKKADGSYSTSDDECKITDSYENWRYTSNTALSDTAGWSHTEALITDQTNADYLGQRILEFRKGTLTNEDGDIIDNQGFKDWFIPAAGQLAYMYLKMDEINSLLDKCGGATLGTFRWHWSSSEYNSGRAWGVDFSCGGVGIDWKQYNNFVRFLRDITY